MNRRYWRPALSTTVYERRPPIGALIGVNGKPWRVIETRDINPGNWTDRARDEWFEAGMPDPWKLAPFEVVVTPPDSDTLHSVTVQPQHFPTWNILPEHYAVCALCGELAPCLGHDAAIEAGRAAKRAERDMATPDGFCPACQEPITTRQKSYAFPGANLLNPLGADEVRFHQRRKCESSAAHYEELWVRADPSRKRSLLTLKCTGSLISHADGSAECVGRQDGSDCPTIYAYHGHQSACWCQSHGCPRVECQGSRHGIRLPKGLRADGSKP